MNADMEALKEQFENAYRKVLLCVEGAHLKGYEIRPVIDKDLNLVRVDYWPSLQSPTG